FGVSEFALVEIEHSEVVQRRGNVDGFFTRSLLADSEGPLVGRLGLRVLMQDMIDRRQVVENRGDIQVILPLGLLGKRKLALVKQPGLLGLSLHVVEAGERVQTLAHVGMLAAKRLLADRERPLRQRLRVRGLALPTEHPRKVVERCGKSWVVRAKSLRDPLRGPEPPFSLGEMAMLVGLPACVVFGLPLRFLGQRRPREAYDCHQRRREPSALDLSHWVFPSCSSDVRSLSASFQPGAWTQSLGLSQGFASGKLSRPVVQSRCLKPTL